MMFHCCVLSVYLVYLVYQKDLLVLLYKCNSEAAKNEDIEDIRRRTSKVDCSAR
jgi:hypothetical protein